MRTLKPGIYKTKLTVFVKSKKYSPRSKENLVSKTEIEHTIWKVDNAVEQRDVEHNIIEKTEEEELLLNQS
jgi:hypothetical protein